MTIPADLSRLSPGDHVQDLFLVLEVETRTGDYPHTVLILGNCTGRISSSPFWAEELPKIAGIERRTIVQVTGEIATYRQHLQLRVTSVRIAPPGMARAADFLPSVPHRDEHWGYLDQARENIKAPRLRDVLDLFFADTGFRERFALCPASLAGHHARIGGLLMHTREVAEIALTLARVACADAELVVAAALLHDIGKLAAYTWEHAFEPTELEALHGHVVLGALMLDRAVRGTARPPCSEQELAILLHLILSHHGKAELGAPVRPITLEAEILHYADNASAKTASMAEAIQSPAHFVDGTSVSASKIWQVDRRRIYRGGSHWGRQAT